MPEYMYIFRGIESQKQSLSPEQMQKLMERWSRWAKSFAERDALKGGSPLAEGGKVVDSQLAISDGPFAESKELIGGYFVVECASLDEAAEYAKACPGLEHPGMTVEIRPLRT